MPPQASPNSSKTDFDVIVLGGGVVGINTAYFNLKNGKSVCIVDRQPEAGLETSFANGGQVSVSHAEPWANPSAPLKVLKWLMQSDAPLLFRPRMDIHQWLWIARFLVDCLPHRANRHTTEIVKLAVQSRSLIQQIRSDENFHYDERSKGILHFYRSAREFEAAIPVAELMRRYGCERTVIDADKVVEIEPAFAGKRHEIAGATYTAADESGDALNFTQNLSLVCEKMGATFLYNTQVTALGADRASGDVSSVEVVGPDGYKTLRARDIVVSMGSWSAPFLRNYGINLTIYPAKGYSVTIPTDGSNMAPVTSLTDDEYKLVYSNYGSRLRVAGTAELSGYTRDLNRTRCQAIVDNVKQLFPQAGNFDAATFWSGLRPATPSNIPYVGRTRYRNLWLNTGHGTLGWTLGAGSGFRVAGMIAEGEGPMAA
ncbi:D-amino acid dehydrogenase [Undibacter mobilis]|uniref:FAD-dependent oxidoreductase n=1 Tax=Undibacter mobilis TaxID=2292256 RepID=A0A371BCP0_9BRAD|nr:D-amino acid dehydrogenase [Undibacter mobilis]RDV05356.1 FAD-dependent oxidoreductase [Undibacter mobilis]